MTLEITKNLTPQLQMLEAKDRFYLVKVHVARLLAPQQISRPFVYKKKGWGQIERIETQTDGTPTVVRTPLRKRRIRKGEEETKEADCWTFLKIGENLHIPWGGQWGLFKTGLRRVLDAENKIKYDNPRLDLMRIVSKDEVENDGELCECGQSGCVTTGAPCESMKGKSNPLVVLETRHTPRGDVMVEAFFDYVTDRDLEFCLEVDSECPINEERLVGLIKAISTLDSFGPSKRGQVLVTSISEVKLKS